MSAAEPRVLRGYQVAAADAVERDWQAGIRRVGVVLPTGAGKSTVIGELINRGHRRGQRAVILAHRGELLDQMRRDLLAVNPLINPYISASGDLQPVTARAYLDRARTDQGMIRDGDVVVRTFAGHGWQWGGHWREPIDYQHFERR